MKPEAVGSAVEDFVSFLRRQYPSIVIGVCEVIDRLTPGTGLPDQSFSIKAATLRQYLSVVLEDTPSVFLWKHKYLSPAAPNLAPLLSDGAHLDSRGQYLLYRSYRGICFNIFANFSCQFQLGSKFITFIVIDLGLSWHIFCLFSCWGKAILILAFWTVIPRLSVTLNHI